MKETRREEGGRGSGDEGRPFVLPDGRKEDAGTIQLADGTMRDIRFDITAFYGKFQG